MLLQIYDLNVPAKHTPWASRFAKATSRQSRRSFRRKRRFRVRPEPLLSATEVLCALQKRQVAGAHLVLVRWAFWRIVFDWRMKSAGGDGLELFFLRFLAC